MTQDLLLKFKFFQDIRMWPKNSDFDYEGWLENFSQDEQKIAQKILDFFVYFPDDIIDQMFSTVVGRAGYFFKKFDNGDDSLNDSLSDSVNKTYLTIKANPGIKKIAVSATMMI